MVMAGEVAKRKGYCLWNLQLAENLRKTGMGEDSSYGNSNPIM
jgi:hypothetical protein